MKAENFGASLDGVTLKLGQQDFELQCGFARGRITAVVGPSGSGKSTLLNLVAGFEVPDAGRVMIDGQEMGETSPAQRPVSVVFQDNNLFAHLDIFTNVGLGISPSLKLSSEEKSAILRALDRVGLSGFERRMPATMSGGERQRAALARALVRRRAVMLLDEPFAALDPGLRAGMAGFLKELHIELGGTILLVTHHPDDIRRLADCVVFLARGRAIFQGSSDEFFNATHLDDIRAFLAE